MRTTVTLPPDLHAYLRELAHQEHKTMSEVVVALLRRSCEPAYDPPAEAIEPGARGFPVVSVGRTVTSEDVRSLDDE